MKTPLGQLWVNAAAVAAGAMSRADSDVHGTERAKTRYLGMTGEARAAMEKEVVARFGKTAWTDFTTAIGGG